MKSDSLESKLNSSDLKGKVRKMSNRNQLTEKNLLRFWFAPDKNKMIIHLYNKSVFELEKGHPLIEDLKKLQHCNSFKNLKGKLINTTMIDEIKLGVNLTKHDEKCDITIYIKNGEFFEFKNQDFSILDEIKPLI